MPMHESENTLLLFCGKRSFNIFDLTAVRMLILKILQIFNRDKCLDFPHPIVLNRAYLEQSTDRKVTRLVMAC